MTKKIKTINIQEGHKFCNKCSRVLPDWAFYPRKLRYSMGKYPYCKECVKRESNQYYHQSESRRLKIIKRIQAYQSKHKHN